VMVAAVAPSLEPLWLSKRLAQVLSDSRLDPRNGVTPGPVAVAGFAEPSLVFALGTETELGTPQDAAEALADGRPAIVEKRAEPAFRTAALALGVTPAPAAVVEGRNYSDGLEEQLTLYRPPPLPAAD
jgi:hypothetical protein